jgi:hypothetical protein
VRGHRLAVQPADPPGQPVAGQRLPAEEEVRDHVALADLAALRAADPGLLTYVQLCDAPLAAPPDPVHEARAARLLPGEGQLPLPDLLTALPDGIPVTVEAPRAADDTSPEEFAARARLALDSVLSRAASQSTFQKKERP